VNELKVIDTQGGITDLGQSLLSIITVEHHFNCILTLQFSHVENSLHFNLADFWQLISLSN